MTTDVVERFTPAEAAAWIAHGRARWANNRRMNVANRADSGKYARPENDDLGMIGEGIGARRWGRRLDTALGEYDNVDLEIIEVRGRGVDTLGELPIKRVDIGKLNLPFVVMVIDVARGQARLRGWLTGWQALERPDGKGRGCKQYFADQETWYVAPPYWTIAALDQWVGCGAPRLWLPWDFDPQRPDCNRRLPFYAEDL